MRPPLLQIIAVILLIVPLVAACRSNSQPNNPKSESTTLTTATDTPVSDPRQPTPSAVAMENPSMITSPQDKLELSRTATAKALDRAPSPTPFPNWKATIASNGIQPCKSEELPASAFWQGTTGSLSGSVSFTNTGMRCVLAGVPYLHILDGSGTDLLLPNVGYETLHVFPPEEVLDVIILDPGDRAYVGFVWTNYCGPKEKPGPMLFLLTWPDNNVEITANLVDVPVRSQHYTARCDAPDRPSMVRASGFIPIFN